MQLITLQLKPLMLTYNYAGRAKEIKTKYEV